MRAKWRACFIDINGRHRRIDLALAGLEPAVDLINDVYATPTSHNTAVLVALLKRLERINNLHCTIPTGFSKISSCGPYAFVQSLSTTWTANFSNQSPKKLAAYFHTRPSSGRYGKLKGAYLRQLVRRMWSVNRMFTIAWHGEYPPFRIFSEYKSNMHANLQKQSRYHSNVLCIWYEVGHKLWGSIGVFCEQSAFWPCAYEPPAERLILTRPAKIDCVTFKAFAQ